MTSVWWTLLGVAMGVIGMLPIARGLLRRGEKRARLAERRARDSERLAELGSMTGGLAHEIKNPLSTIGLNAQLLGESIGDSDLPDDQRDRLLRRLESLSREIERLSGILNDFLQFAGRMKLDPQAHDLARIVEEVCDFFHPQCTQSGITMRVQNEDSTIRVNVDEGMIKQALLNLMINAQQAIASQPRHEDSSVPSGELIIRVEADDAEARVRVIDTGPGIESEKLEAIFHPYVSHKSGGTGLGLPTAKRILEEHGGGLSVTSEPGQGSEFVIAIPRVPCG
ncbi:MAG: HAMP domain-containing sensor histidine kinase [Planctomycetota bacterium]|nr:HAMP domain-containing sensor histidine kinase [Planctomycetota bacterium]